MKIKTGPPMIANKVAAGISLGWITRRPMVSTASINQAPARAAKGTTAR